MEKHGTDFWLIPHWWSLHATISAQRQRCRGNVSEATGPTQKASPGIGIWVDLRWAGGSHGARKKLGDPNLFEWEMGDIQLIAVKLGYPYPISNRNGRWYWYVYWILDDPSLICHSDIDWMSLGEMGLGWSWQVKIPATGRWLGMAYAKNGNNAGKDEGYGQQIGLWTRRREIPIS